MPITIAQLNSLSREEFVRVIGPVFEHSPWIADTTWPQQPFVDFKHLHSALNRTVAEASQESQLKLIRAHPDLVGRAALAGTLTPQSTSEQAGAGLDKLQPDEIARFQKLNHDYQQKFGFPFVICARLNKKEAILNGFNLRLTNSRESEIQKALEEIGKIADFRLRDLIHG